MTTFKIHSSIGKVCTFLLTVCLLLTCFAIPTFAISPRKFRFTGRVHIPSDWASLTMHAEASANSDAIYEYENKQTVAVIEQRGSWYVVEEYEAGKYYWGFVAAKYVDFVRDYPIPTMPYDGEVETNGNNLRLRSNAGTSFSIVKSIPIGTKVKVLDWKDCVDGSNAAEIWADCEVQIGGTTYKGYAALEYIVNLEAEANKPKPPTPEPPPTPPAPPTPPLEFESLPHTDKVPNFNWPYLDGLTQWHPNWKFVFYESDIDFWDFVEKQSTVYYASNGQLACKSLIENTFPLSYRNAEYQNTVIENKRWYAANAQTVAFYLDPRNFFDTEHIFQFEDLTYNPEIHSLHGVEIAIQGTFMENQTITTTDGNTVTYAEAILKAGKESGVSPYHIASRILKENGSKGSGTTRGNYPGYEGYYNFFNIGANTHGNVVENALSFAKDENGERTYGRPWDTPYKAIIEGSKWLASKYIAKKQDTIYYQKFDLVPPKPGNHQYQTAIYAPYGEAKTVYNTYRGMGLLEYPHVFKIPVFKNMPPIQHLPDFSTGDVYRNRKGDTTGDGNLTSADYDELVKCVIKYNYVPDNGPAFITRDLNDDIAIDAFDIALLNDLLKQNK